MEPRLLKQHKHAAKRLVAPPVFKAWRRGRLPKPLDKMGGARLFASDLTAVGGAYYVCFAWRDGSLLADSSFFAWLFSGEPGRLFPLAILHYHPSHKPAHMLMPCRDERDFTNRQLPGVIEFNVAPAVFDPRQEADRGRLIALFCQRCGIVLGAEGGLL